MSDTVGAAQERAETENMFRRLTQWVNGPRVETCEVRAGAAPRLWNEALDQIGAENEDLKDSCLDIVRRFDEFSHFRNSLITVFERMGEILNAREEMSATLVERGMAVALTEGALRDMKAEARALYACKEELRSENSLLNAENERLKTSIRARESRIEAVEADLQHTTDIASTLRADLEATEAERHRVAGELERARAEIHRNDALISSLQSELATTRDQHAFADRQVATLQAKLAERQQAYAKLETQHADGEAYAKSLSEHIREMEITLDAERRRGGELDALLATTQAEQQKLQAGWQQQTEKDRLTIAELQSQVAELTTHVEAGGRLLGEVRAQLQAMTDSFRAEERRAQESEAQLARLTERYDAESTEAAATRTQLAARERAHSRLTGRARGLIRAMRDLGADLEKSQQRAELAAERLALETRRFEEGSAALEDRIGQLTEQLERERLARTATEGALEAARQRRAAMREEVRLSDILARADEPRALTGDHPA